jgi:hypothetical protein
MRTLRAGRFTLDALRALPLQRMHPLAEYLRERGVTFEEGALYLGVTPRTITRWVGGHAHPCWAQGSRIASALGFKDTDLFPPKWPPG